MEISVGEGIVTAVVSGVFGLLVAIARAISSFRKADAEKHQFLEDSVAEASKQSTVQHLELQGDVRHVSDKLDAHRRITETQLSGLDSRVDRIEKNQDEFARYLPRRTVEE